MIRSVTVCTILERTSGYDNRDGPVVFRFSDRAREVSVTVALCQIVRPAKGQNDGKMRETVTLRGLKIAFTSCTGNRV